MTANRLAKSVGFVTRDRQIDEIFELLSIVAETDATVLITGETGTGKELMARAIHRCSHRKDRSLITMNCGAVCESLQDSELFGYVAGAFTGAIRNVQGKIEAADGGTLFLDEVSESSNNLQVRLLRVLQSGEYSRVGEPNCRHCNIRVIAATNLRLEDQIRTGRFRKDLFYRLNIIHVEIPPLRNRLYDVPLLINYFIKKRCDFYQKSNLQVADRVYSLLQQYQFPGNVRELQNIIEHAVIVCRSNHIDLVDLPTSLNPPQAAETQSLPARFHEAKARTIEQFERAYLTSKLEECRGVVASAARLSGLSERNFHAKLKQYGISSKRFRRALDAPV